MSKRQHKSFRVPSMNSRVLRADEDARRYHGGLSEGGERLISYRAWHRGYHAAIRDARVALKKEFSE